VPRWPSPALVLISDRARLRGRSFPEIAAQAVAAGVTAVQVRERDLPAAELLALVEAVRAAVGDRASVLVNDRLDVALACDAGAHLPERGLPPAVARRLLGKSPLLGRSVHSVDAARASAGVDYLHVGAVYETISKPGARPAGVSLVRDVAAATDLPVVAVGGITPERIAEVIEAGARGVAVIGAILDADDPGRAAAGLRHALDRAVSKLET